MTQMTITRPEFLEVSDSNPEQASSEAILIQSEPGLGQPLFARDFLFGALWTSALLLTLFLG